MNIYKNWIEKKNALNKAKEELLQAEKILYLEHREYLSDRPDGTSTIKDDGYILKVVKKTSISINQNKVVELGLEKNSAIKIKYDLDKRNYKNLSLTDKELIDEAIITKPSKPSFTVSEEEQ